MRTNFSSLIAVPLVVGLAANGWMYLRARRELKVSNEPLNKYFAFHRSQLAWLKDYKKLARARGLPTWPVSVPWVAWIATVVILILWFLPHSSQR